MAQIRLRRDWKVGMTDPENKDPQARFEALLAQVLTDDEKAQERESAGA